MKEKKLKKNLGLASALSIVVGCVIGSGVFFKPQAIYTATNGAPGLGIIAWIVTGLVSIAAALTFAEVAVSIPKTGGIMTYCHELYGDKIGFLAGWSQSIIFYPAMISALAVATANQMALFVGDGFVAPLAISCIIIIILFNTLGNKVASRVQIIFTICKMIPLILITIFGFVFSNGSDILSPMIGEGVTPVSCFGQLMVAILFAFEGWTGVGAIAGEMKNTNRDLPLAIVGGVSFIMAVYLVINIAYLQVLPASTLMNLDAPASAVAIALFGDIGGKIVSVGIMISCFGACNGFILTGSRVVYAMAMEKLLPASSYLTKLNNQHVPFGSILLVSIIASIYALSGQFNLLTDLAVFSSWSFYTLSFIGVIKLRKKHVESEYHVPLYPIIPLIAIFSGIFVIFNQLFLSGIYSTLLSLGSICILLVGLPVYHYVKKL